MITYTIFETRFSVNPDGTQDRIDLILWRAEKTNESVVGRLGIRGTVIPADYAPADIEYQAVTEQDAIDWVTDLEDQESIELQLDTVIAELTNPTEGSGRPWQDSFPLWAVGVDYVLDDVVIYQNIGYEIVQPHTSQAQWAPPVTPALWKPYVPPSEGPQPWVQPLGSEDAYPLGAQVTHLGNLWTSEIDANVFEPGVSSWADEGAFP